jgi:hypothetical protein
LVAILFINPPPPPKKTSGNVRRVNIGESTIRKVDYKIGVMEPNHLYD